LKSSEHRHILTAEKQDNIFFIVMSSGSGETLEAIVARDGAIDLPLALDYTCQICNAIEHAHRQGVPTAICVRRTFVSRTTA